MMRKQVPCQLVRCTAEAARSQDAGMLLLQTRLYLRAWSVMSLWPCHECTVVTLLCGPGNKAWHSSAQAERVLEQMQIGSTVAWVSLGII